ncbi:MAG: hypothetical protein NXI20_17170 [bacterium]|nr:hypothetical protein [bacterium]
MKQVLIIFTLIFQFTNLFCQSPEKMSYQAVIRDSDNNLISNQSVGMRISIIQGSLDGNEVYTETQVPISNSNGLISIEIGDGNVEFGQFGGIDWGNGPYYVKTEIDPTGNTNYSITSTNQLLSVPYALYAKSSGSSYWAKNELGINYLSDHVGIGTSNPFYKLDINDSISTGNRTFLNVENKDISSTSSAALEVKAGSLENYTVLRMHGDNYAYSWWGKHGQLKTTGDGLIIEATKSDKSGGDIVFVNGSTGGNSNIKTINMKIDGDGNIGVGTDTPLEKLQIKSGDIYLEDVNSGVILKSENGACWRMTVDNSGIPTTSATTCPEDL